MGETDQAEAAALKIQSRYRAFRTRRELAGLQLSKPEWHAVLGKVDILLRTSQFADAQPKQLSVRGKWIRGLGSASAIGRVRSECTVLLACYVQGCKLYASADRAVQVEMTGCYCEKNIGQIPCTVQFTHSLLQA